METCKQTKTRTETRWAVITEGHGYKVSIHDIDLNHGHHHEHCGKSFWIGKPVERQEAITEFRQYLECDYTKYEDGEGSETCMKVLSHTYNNRTKRVVEVDVEIEMRLEDGEYVEYETVKAIKQAKSWLQLQKENHNIINS